MVVSRAVDGDKSAYCLHPLCTVVVRDFSGFLIENHARQKDGVPPMTMEACVVSFMNTKLQSAASKAGRPVGILSTVMCVCSVFTNWC